MRTIQERKKIRLMFGTESELGHLETTGTDPANCRFPSGSIFNMIGRFCGRGSSQAPCAEPCSRWT